jgi:hypothetical protein
MTFDIQAAVAQAAAEGPNMNESQGGGDFERELPVAGMTRLRLISYIELGKHAKTFAGEEKLKNLVYLEFELSGPKHPPKEIDGKVYPQTISMTENLSLSEKANFYKLFRRLNHTGDKKHFAEFLGASAFIGTVYHNSTGEGDTKKTYANLWDKTNGNSIRPPYVDDPETGESRLVQVDPAISKLRLFLWEFASKEMWDSLFIDGRWDDKKDDKGVVIKEGTSKNYFQNQIKKAANFQGSPIAEILFAGGEEPDLPESEAPERTDDAKQAGVEKDAGAANDGADADPLANVA